MCILHFTFRFNGGKMKLIFGLVRSVFFYSTKFIIIRFAIFVFFVVLFFGYQNHYHDDDHNTGCLPKTVQH